MKETAEEIELVQQKLNKYIAGCSDESIILIGMPGAGKSTIGPLLAAKLDLLFEDTDILVKKTDGRALKDIVAEDGFEKFLSIQQEAIMSHELKRTVVATGGSVIKSDVLMQYFKSIGRIIYLKLDYEILKQRLAPGRRLAKVNSQTFREVFDERKALYIKYAENIIECSGKTPEEIVAEIYHLCTV